MCVLGSTMIYLEKEKKYGAHSHVRATARFEEHIIHSRGQRYVVPLKYELEQINKMWLFVICTPPDLLTSLY